MRAPIERRLIAALLQPGIGASERATILRALKSHAFTDPDCQVIFRAIATAPPWDEDEARQALNQAVTRLGFPDIALESFFGEPPPAAEEVAALLNELRPPQQTS